jgi:hypothetical protein
MPNVLPATPASPLLLLLLLLRYRDVFQIKTGDRRSMTKIIPTNRKLIAPAS